MNDALIESLHRAVEAAPDDLTRRLYLAELLVGAGRGDEAVTYLGLALAMGGEFGYAGQPEAFAHKPREVLDNSADRSRPARGTYARGDRMPCLVDGAGDGARVGAIEHIRSEGPE